MGAQDFSVKAKGKTHNDAFVAARDEAAYERGHGGYTGTIAEKHSFIMIPLPEGEQAEDYADKLVRDGDPRIQDKWGPAGCIDLGNGEWLFFGTASS